MAISAAQLNVIFTEQGAAKVKSEIQSLGDAVDRAGASYGALGGMGAGAFAGLGAVILTGVNNAMQLEQSITNVSASLGGLSGGELAQLTADMQQLGTNSQYSATEVANVAEELAKAGYAVDDMRDMSEAVINLSQATGSGLQIATTGVTQAMAIWAEEVVGVENALTDAADAADILTVAANSSSADVDDIIAGIRNLGPIAADMGVGFDEASAAIALFTNYGLKGADAGTSLARGLQNLAAPTDAVADKLEDLGLSMEGLGIAAFDMEGNFVGFPELFRQLQSGLSGFSDQTRLAALSAIFGAEAMDVMSMAISTGADPLQEMISLMEESGVAAEQAAMRTETLSGAWQRVQEATGTLLGTMMSGLVEPLTMAADGIAGLAELVNGLPSEVTGAIGAITALGTALIGLNAAKNLLMAGAGAGFFGQFGKMAVGGAGLGAMVKQAGSLAMSLSGLRMVMNPLGAAITGVAFVGGKLVSSFMEQREAAEEYRQSVSNLEMTLETLRRQGDTELADMGDALGDTIDNLDEKMQSFQDDLVAPTWEEYFDTRAMEEFGQAFDSSNQAMRDASTQWIQDYRAVVAEADELRMEMAKLTISDDEMSGLNSLLTEALQDPNINVEAWITWASSLLTAAENGEQLDAAVATILGRPLSDFARTSAEGFNDLNASMEETLATTARVAEIFDQLPADIDDLRIEGMDQQADDILALGDALEQAFGGDYTASSLDFEQGGFQPLIAEAIQFADISEDSAGRLETAWGRISDAMESGDFDNAQLIADIMAVIADTSLNGDEKVAEIEAISTSLNEYVDELSAAQDAQIEFLDNGQNLNAWWLEYTALMNQGAASMDGTQAQMDALQAKADFRALVQFTADLDAAKASLDSVLDTFGRIDDLGSRSESAGSIAENLVGTAGEWAAIDDMLDRWLGQAESVDEVNAAYARYNETVASGYAIQESNARVQEHLNDMRADQLPLLEQEQLAYEQQIEALSQLPALEQRRALALQDSAVQAELASMYSLAYSASLGEVPEEVATSMIVSAAEADPVIKDLLLQYGLIEEGATGEISVNFPNADATVQAIDRVTQALLLLQSGGDTMGAYQIAVEIYGQEEADAMFARYTEADGMTSTMGVTVNADGAVETVDWVYDRVIEADGTEAYMVLKANADTGELEAFGEIVESYTDEEKVTHIKVQTDDGEYWTTIDLLTGEIGETATISTAADTSGAEADIAGLSSIIGPVTVPIEWEAPPAFDPTTLGPVQGPAMSPTPVVNDQSVTITADDQASGVIADIQSSVDALSGASAMVTVDVTDNASATLLDVGSSLGGLDAASATVIVNGNNGPALTAIDMVRMALSDIDGQSSLIVVNGDNAGAMGAIGEVAAYDGVVLATSYHDIVVRQFGSASAVGAGIGAGILAGFDQALDINSPSEEMDKRGEYMFAGLFNGWEREANDLPISLSSPTATLPFVGSEAVSGARGGTAFAPQISISIDATGKNINEERIVDMTVTQVFDALETARYRYDRSMGVL